jgi:hypothetical protein
MRRPRTVRWAVELKRLRDKAELGAKLMGANGDEYWYDADLIHFSIHRDLEGARLMLCYAGRSTSIFCQEPGEPPDSGVMLDLADAVSDVLHAPYRCPSAACAACLSYSSKR